MQMLSFTAIKVPSMGDNGISVFLREGWQQDA